MQDVTEEVAEVLLGKKANKGLIPQVCHKLNPSYTLPLTPFKAAVTKSHSPVSNWIHFCPGATAKRRSVCFPADLQLLPRAWRSCSCGAPGSRGGKSAQR